MSLRLRFCFPLDEPFLFVYTLSMNIIGITKTNGFKIVVLMVLILLFLIPVGMIRGIIWERSRRASEAETDIMASWGEEFLVLGPILQIPGKTYVTFIRQNGEREIQETDFTLNVVPEELNVAVQLSTETKKRGIFSVPLFAGTVTLTGQFNPDKIAKQLRENQKIFPEQAELLIALASQRGIRGIDYARWNEGTIDFMPGAQGLAFQEIAGGIYGSAPIAVTKPDRTADSVMPGAQGFAGGISGSAPIAGEQPNRFDISMAIQGGKSLRMAPLGEESTLTLRADWTAPSFQGSYLPASHRIGADGFDAEWRISHLSRSIPLAWNDAAGFEISSSIFGVNFYKALDHYGANTRAVKYALLFIIIPFLSLFLFEFFLRRNIHPVQYILAGVGNVVFYLLLLSFSERIPFPAAYWIAALSVTVLLTLYSGSLLGGWKKTPYIAVIMALCYTFLYCTLQSEDWALLIGSIGAFGITALVMFITRKVDWYGGRWSKPADSETNTSDPKAEK